MAAAAGDCRGGGCGRCVWDELEHRRRDGQGAPGPIGAELRRHLEDVRNDIAAPNVRVLLLRSSDTEQLEERAVQRDGSDPLHLGLHVIATAAAAAAAAVATVAAAAAPATAPAAGRLVQLGEKGRELRCELRLGLLCLLHLLRLDLPPQASRLITKGWNVPLVLIKAIRSASLAAQRWACRSRSGRLGISRSGSGRLGISRRHRLISTSRWQCQIGDQAFRRIDGEQESIPQNSSRPSAVAASSWLLCTHGPRATYFEQLQHASLAIHDELQAAAIFQSPRSPERRCATLLAR